jgi:hypothetical protein
MEEHLLAELDAAAALASVPPEDVDALRQTLLRQSSNILPPTTPKGSAAAAAAAGDGGKGGRRSTEDARPTTDRGSRAPPQRHLSEFIQTLPQLHRHKLSQLDTLHKMVAGFCRRQEQQRTYDFLLATARGDLEAMRSLMAQGVAASTADYDRRTALMVAAHEGQDGALRLLLSMGGSRALDMKDSYGNTAL